MPWLLILALGGAGYFWWKSHQVTPPTSPALPPPAPSQTPPSDPAQPPPAMIWQAIQPATSGDYTVEQGQRYAVLASVSKGKTLQQVVDYLNGHGWSVTYSWEYGTATRDQYQIDTTLAALSPDPNGDHRWVYIEGDRTGGTDTIGKKAPWPLTLYLIQWAMQAVPNPAAVG